MHVLGSGKFACATEIPPPLFVYWKHIAALALGMLATISAKAAVIKRIGLSIEPSCLLERPRIKRSVQNECALNYNR
jgi:hypothetical protein